jgi:hypothetical protein
MATTPDFSKHPIEVLPLLRRKYGKNLELSFSRYWYLPQSRQDPRETFQVRIGEVTQSWLAKELSNLSKGQELAFESRARLGNLRLHLPMLDFKGMLAGQLRAVMEIFPDLVDRKIFVYFTGRSFHAYFPELISHRDWVRFMGSALLCNTPRNPGVVDQRWIGHRLIAGYSALRWSCNSKHYKRFPRKVFTKLLDSPANVKRKLLKRR